MAGASSYARTPFTADLGLMKDWAVLSSVARAQDSDGYASDTPSAEVRVPCQWLPGDGQELNQAGAMRGESRDRIRIRARTDVRAGWQVEVRGTSYEVLAAPFFTDGRREFMWVLLGAVESAST